MNKFVAIFLTCSFLVLNSLYPAPLLAAPPPSDTSPVLPPLSLLKVPPEFGSVTETYTGEDPRTVLLIQDAHAVPDAQRSIQKIVDYFLEKHGIRLVALEGASGRLNPLLLRAFPDRKLLQKVISTYLDKGELSGAAAASFLSRPEADYYGIENQPLYEKGIDAFLRSLKMQPALLARLEAEVRNLEVLKEGAYSPGLLEFDRILNAFHDNPGRFPKLLRYLEIQARKHPKLSQRYPHLVSFLTRKKRLIAKLSSSRPHQDILSEGLLTKMKAPAFFDEFDALSKEIKKGLIQSPQESTLDQRDQRSRLLLKMVQFQLTREDWREVQSIQLSSDFQDFIRFYQISADRDAAFVKNLLTLLEEKTNTSIVVAGGFHTAGFKEAFKQARISYALIAPRIEQVPKDTRYLDLMQGRVSWQSYFKPQRGRVDAYDAFHRALFDQLLTSPEAIPLLAEWRERFLFRLSNHGEFSKALRFLRLFDEAAVQLVPEEKLNRSKKEWLQRVDDAINGLVKGVSPLTRETTQVPWIVPWGSYPAEWIISSKRSELRNTEVATSNEKDESVFSRQWEAGNPRHISEKIKSKYGRRIAELVSQTTLTGGLGALMYDLFDAWHKNGVDVTAMVPIYEKIKGQEYYDPEVLSPDERFGQYLRDPDIVGPKSDIQFSFRLQYDEEFKSWAQGSLARQVIDRNREGKRLTKDFITSFYEAKTDSGAPLFYMDVFVLDEKGEKVRIFNELYPDDSLWKEVQMTVYAYASERLTMELQKRNRVKDNVLFMDNEMYVSFPTPNLPGARRMHVNHTVVEAGMPRPSRVSFRLLRLPEVERRRLIRDSHVEIPKEIAASYDAITGVSLEHNNVLKSLFRAFLPKIREFNQSGIRNTNGVLLDHWQSPLLRALIERHKATLLAKRRQRSTVQESDRLLDDASFFLQLKQNGNQRALQRQLVRQFEWIKVYHVVELFHWLDHEQIHKKYFHPQWLEDAIQKYQVRYKELFDENDPDPHQTFRDYQKLVYQAVSFEEPSGWSDKKWKALEKDAKNEKFRILKEVLIKDPIMTNTRRQVSYKGPEKWLELLNGLKDRMIEELEAKLRQEIKEEPSDDLKQLVRQLVEDTGSPRQKLSSLFTSPGPLDELHQIDKVESWTTRLGDRIAETPAMKEFRGEIGKILFGGRIFDWDSWHNFHNIRKLVEELHLQDRIALVENYNLYTAPLIYQAAGGVVMLSDEKREASATSMMKGLVNGAVLIGVMSGAMSELFSILDIMARKVVDLVEHWLSYDTVAELLKRKIYAVTNGFLVNFKEESRTSQFQLRKPQSLEKALKEMRRNWGDPEKRMSFEFEALATSPKVDMEKGQARAHILMWQEIEAERQSEDRLFESLPRWTPREIESFLAKKEFLWRKAQERGGSPRFLHMGPTGGGFLGTVEGNRWIRDDISRSKQSDLSDEGYDSLLYHGRRITADDMGDLISHHLTHVFNDNGWQLVREKLKEFGREAAKDRDDELNVIKSNLKALDLIEKISLHLSAEILRHYLTLREQWDSEDFRVIERLLKDRRVRENLVRYLDRNAVKIESSRGTVQAYVLPFEGKRLILSVNISSEDRALTHLDGRDTFAKVLGEEVLTQPDRAVYVKDFITNASYPSERIHYDDFPVIVPDPGVQILEIEFDGDLEATHRLLATFEAAAAGKAEKPPNEIIRSQIEVLSRQPEKLRNILERMTRFSREEITERVGLEGIPPLMVFIFGLAPDLLKEKNFSSWNPATAENLDRMQKSDNLSDILNQGSVLPHSTNQNGAVAFSRVFENRQVVFLLQFDQNTPRDGEGKRWFGITDPGSFGAVDSDEMKYHFFDLLSEPRTSYPSFSGREFHQGKVLFGIPSSGFQILEKYRSASPSDSRSEMRRFEPDLSIQHFLTSLAKEGSQQESRRELGEYLRVYGLPRLERRLRTEAEENSNFFGTLLSLNRSVPAWDKASFLSQQKNSFVSDQENPSAQIALEAVSGSYYSRMA